MDCWGCRTASARFCAACVQQATAERQRGITEFAAENRRLVSIMAEGLDERARALAQAEARLSHARTVAKLAAELATVRREADQQAVIVNELRHSVRRASSRFSRAKAAAGRGDGEAAAGHCVGTAGGAGREPGPSPSWEPASSRELASRELADELRARLSERRRELLCAPPLP